MNKKYILISVVLLFVLVLSSCGVYEQCPGAGSTEKHTESNA